jgi:hypothetical protein
MSQAEPNSMFPFHHSQRHGVIEMKSQGKRGGKKIYISTFGELRRETKKSFSFVLRKKKKERKKVLRSKDEVSRI